MDTGLVIARQLRYCRRGAEAEGNQAQIAQIEWWEAKIAELRKQQPSAEAPVVTLEPVHAATGTEGPH